MKTFIEISKKAKEKVKHDNEFKLAILGDCSTQHLAKAIKGQGNIEDIGISVLDTDYNQINVQIMSQNSEMYCFNPDGILIVMCTEKLYDEYCNTGLSERNQFATKVYTRISNYWDLINKRLKTNIIQFTFAEMDDRVVGNCGLRIKTSFAYQLRRLNYLLMEACTEYKNIFLLDINHSFFLAGGDQACDFRLYYLARMAFSEKVLPIIAKNVTDIIKATLGKIKKCIVIDLDNTLWGGIIGEDGIEKIQIGELGIGRVFSDFQMWLKELQKRGILLAVCSKNDEDKAKDPFINHPDMILRLEDISLFVANWENKVENILYIQKTLNIGMDSIVYIDDSQFERNLVRNMIPDIEVPELPEDPALYLSFLKKNNYFETISFSETDKERTKQYKTEMLRKSKEKMFESYDEYLKELFMKGECTHFKPFNYARIAQLIQRSNQFNLRTIRYSEEEISRIAGDKNYITLSFTLKDCYGEYGLVSAVILRRKDNESLFIDSWVMSCRVLKRGMEEFVINEIFKVAQKNGYRFVIGEYIITPKNSMVKDIYMKMGFRDNLNGTFIADVEKYKIKETFIN
ncbi:HAD-IIIC family phosphatase [Clostridium sp. LP20]|uniref:HAD-IIIC family phosphatase n=1 Tax=Clostridium sp. LP20 TaxID=3418665 RepID=UPI003EE49849